MPMIVPSTPHSLPTGTGLSHIQNKADTMRIPRIPKICAVNTAVVYSAPHSETIHAATSESTMQMAMRIKPPRLASANNKSFAFITSI